ncbi:RNA polymerase II elongation factor ELL [Popillia japonica]|uniref:RNA polymerase II elongation factor ELL n=1 Tax=Popillia japonica TaxID=7064 RepID=A0AAW1L7N9_POPJA
MYNKFSKNPTIKFLGTEGQLCFPIQQNESKSFKFSMSSTADMEGPGGSFECVQQSGPPRGSLQALGAIPYKIRIHASDDVYETTRMRMTEAEENHKNKCTREIKPNQTDIGRKVKVKQTPTSSSSSSSSSSALQSRYRRDIQLPRDNIAAKPSYQPNNVPSKPTVKEGPFHSNGLSNGLGNNHVSSTRPKPLMPDIARRPLKERLIHLLALRPYKKPEIIERLTKEGLREKNGVTSVLKQVAFLKDNAYHLNRAMWNDVHENWPFYTESEKQTLKRRKPQNLTPPDSSDGGSSGSGHSPTSTHPGSPPPTITLPKRPNYYDANDGLPSKRIRISRVPTKFTENEKNPPLHLFLAYLPSSPKTRRTHRYTNRGTTTT